MDIGKVVDRNDSDENDGQFDQTPLFSLLFCKLSFAGAKIACTM
jgi:hypothetical protein